MPKTVLVGQMQFGDRLANAMKSYIILWCPDFGSSHFAIPLSPPAAPAPQCFRYGGFEETNPSVAAR